MKDVAMMSIEEVSELIRRGELSPVELTKACLRHIEKLNPGLNAYVYIDKESAINHAVAAEKEIASGNYRGRLHGIPVALKDLYYTKGIPTTAGSEILRDFRPYYDGTIVERLKGAGMIMLGKTNTTEFAFDPTNEESIFGSAKNPWNTSKISGGSSGGSAIAVAVGMAYGAMGTDTGGSVRIPAAMCGAVGFKPTVGLLSTFGIVPLSFTLDHPGTLTRSVADAAIIIDAISGTDERDPCPFAKKCEGTRFYEESSSVSDLKGKVLGIPKNFFFDKTDFEVERVFYEAVERCRALGAEIREVYIPGLDSLPEMSTNLMFAEAAWNHRGWYPARESEYQKAVAARLEKGCRVKATDYIGALRYRDELIKEWEKALCGFDSLLAPTCPIEAYDLGLGEPWSITTRGKTEQGKVMATYHTRLSNMTGAPALSVPAGLTKNNLPVGLMIMGKRNDDCNVLKIGMAYEKSYEYPKPRLI